MFQVNVAVVLVVGCMFHTDVHSGGLGDCVGCGCIRWVGDMVCARLSDPVKVVSSVVLVLTLVRLALIVACVCLGWQSHLPFVGCDHPCVLDVSPCDHFSGPVCGLSNFFLVGVDGVVVQGLSLLLQGCFLIV